jgi:heme-degrading monooxygenase HmoA
MHARMTTIHSPRERMDQGIERIRKEILPAMRDLEGFRGLVGLIQRGANVGITISFWESEEAMAGSEEVGERLRSEAAKAMKAETEAMVNRYEVVLYELGAGEPSD